MQIPFQDFFCGFFALALPLAAAGAGAGLIRLGGGSVFSGGGSGISFSAVAYTALSGSLSQLLVLWDGKLKSE